MISIYLAMISGEDEKRSFEETYVNYKNLMYKAAYSILRDSNLAEDAVHQTFLNVIEMPNFLSDISPDKTKNYMICAVKNVSKNMYMKRKKEFNNYEDDIALGNIPNGYNLEDVVDSEIDVRYVIEKIDGLSESLKSVMFLKFLHGLEDKETAKLLNISAAAVRKRVQRARKILRESEVYTGEKN